MKEVIIKLIEQAVAYEALAGKCRDAVKSLQQVCGHNMQIEGNDSHKDHYKCTICAKEEWI